MAIKHRKLFPEPDSNQTSTCYDCGPTCPYNCSYPEIYWPPQQPPLPLQPTTTTTHISPYAIIIAALLGSAFLFISYYLVMVRYYTSFRRSPSTDISSEAEDLSGEDHGSEIDHPIWYITTVGLQPSMINSITVVKFEKGGNLIDCTDCSVCLSEFQEDETLRLLPKCNHAFHIPCIDTWLRSHTNCPLCRASILSNTLSAVLSSNDRSSPHLTGSNQNTQMESSRNDAEFAAIRAPENEICEEIEDSKSEYESIITARRSSSMDSVAIAEIVLGKFAGDSCDPTVNLQRSDGGGDSRRLMGDNSSVEQ